MTKARAHRHLTETEIRRLARGGATPPAHAASCRTCAKELELVRLLDAAVRSALPPGDCPDAQDLVLHAAGRLMDATARGVDAHLTLCRPCAADHEGLVTARRVAGRLPAPRAAGVATRVATAARDLVSALASLATLDMPASVAVVARGAAASEDFARGMDLYRRRRYADARKRLERAADAGERAPELRFFLAACLLHAKKPADAAELLAGVVRARPRIGEYRWQLAQALLATGRGDEAVAQLAKAARLPGARREAARELGVRVKAVVGGQPDRAKPKRS